MGDISARSLLLLSVVTLPLILGNISGSSSPIKRTEGKKDHCNKTVEVYEDVSSPEVTPENVGKPMTCWYRFRSFRGSPKDWILRIKFNKFKVGTLLNASHCDGGYMQIMFTDDLMSFVLQVIGTKFVEPEFLEGRYVISWNKPHPSRIHIDVVCSQFT